MEALVELLSIDAMAAFVNDTSWVWPVCEILHFAGMALLIGTVGFLDLRILGFAKSIPISSLSKLVPLGIAGFVTNAVTGFVFVTGNPVGGPIDYLGNLAFQLKMLLVLLAGVNLAAFYLAGISRAADAVPAGGDAPRAAKVVAASSLAFWFGVIYLGRMVMYNDTLLYAVGR
jgi:hypothetical protein